MSNYRVLGNTKWEEQLLKKIRNYIDLQVIKQEVPKEFAEYIEGEFQDMYEYLNNGEGVEDFLLPTHQAMTILEDKDEMNDLLKGSIELEFVEEFQLESVTILRIGFFRSEDVQLHYYIKSE